MFYSKILILYKFKSLMNLILEEYFKALYIYYEIK